MLQLNHFVTMGEFKALLKKCATEECNFLKNLKYVLYLYSFCINVLFLYCFFVCVDFYNFVCIFRIGETHIGILLANNTLYKKN